MKGKPCGPYSGKHHSSEKPFRMCVGVFPDSGSNVALKGWSTECFCTVRKQNPFCTGYQTVCQLFTKDFLLTINGISLFSALCSIWTSKQKVNPIIFFIRVFCKLLLVPCLSVSDSTLKGPFPFCCLLDICQTMGAIVSSLPKLLLIKLWFLMQI